jgi:hypothetical protein
MDRKAIIAVITVSLILAFVVDGMQIVEVAKANPISTFPPFPSDPNRDPAILTVESPTNATYYENDIPLNFTVTQPDSWLNQSNVHVTNVKYNLDGETVSVWNTSGRREPTILPPSYLFSTTLNEVAYGEHTLQVRVDSESYYGNSPPMEYQMTTAQTITFKVELNSSSTPSPSLSPTPSSSPTQTSPPTPTLSPSPSIPEFPAWIILALLITAATTLVIILKKREASVS